MNGQINGVASASHKEEFNTPRRNYREESMSVK